MTTRPDPLEPRSPMADPRPDDADTETGPSNHDHHEVGHGGHGTGAVFAALAANAAVAAAKFVGFVFTGSSSMLAESVHSVADSGNQLLLLVGGRRSKKAADEQHPFGYGRESYFWGFVVALVLFVLGSLFALYEGLHKVEHPEPIESAPWALAILGFALVAEGLSFRTAFKAAGRIRGDASLWRFIRRAKSPELPVVLLEDLGAMIGLVLAFAGVSIAVVTDDGRWDGYGTLGIGILLGIIAIVLVVEMKSLLIGEGATRRELDSIRAALTVDPDVVRLIHLRTQYLGPGEILVATKLELLHELNLVEVADTINRVERHVRAAVPAARLIFIEPDVHDEHRAATTYVASHQGEISPDDPDYHRITGIPADPDDDIWVDSRNS